MLVRLPIHIINLIHIFIISSILVYIGYNQTLADDNSYLALLIAASFIPILVPIPSLENISGMTAIQIFHYLAILPFLIYVSYMGYIERNLGDASYNTLFITGIIIFIYHAIRFLYNTVFASN